MIGTILRDQHAVPDVRLVTGERISETLERNGVGGKYPEDMMNLMRQALRMIDHLNSNHKDLHNRRQLELTESRIRRLAKYYIGTGKLDSDWTYKRDQPATQWSSEIYLFSISNCIIAKRWGFEPPTKQVRCGNCLSQSLSYRWLPA